MATMTDGSITIAPFPWARRKKRSFDRIIGCYDPDTRPKKIVRFHRPNPPDLLVLKFVDLDEPAPAPHDIRPELRLPSVDDLKAALAFDREDASLLIHCHAGISRSTAIALAILSQRLGPGKESEAMDELLRIRPEAVPNLHIIRLADEILGRTGRLLGTVLECETPEKTERRQQNRQAYFDYYDIR